MKLGVIDTTDIRYFSEPTPGAINGVGIPTVGPHITDVQHTPVVPSDSDDLVVEARVEETSQAVGSATLHYRIMYGAETSVPMVDNGTGSDAVASLAR